MTPITESKEEFVYEPDPIETCARCKERPATLGHFRNHGPLCPMCVVELMQTRV